MKYLLTALIILGHLSLGAQWFFPFYPLYPNVPNGQMYDVEVNADGYGYAIGDDDTFLRTANAGVDWEPFELGLSNSSVELAMIPDGNAQSALILTSNRLYQTTNGGQDWAMTQLDLSGAAQSLVVIDEQHWVVSSNNALISTADGGMSWTDITPATSLNWWSCHFVSPTHGWLGSDDGKIYRTTDGGTEWALVNEDFADPVRLQFLTENTGFAGIKKQFCKTTDGGLTWTVVNANAFGFNVAELRAVTEDWIVAAQGNRVYATTNGGLDMETVFPVTYPYLHYGICPLADGRVWVAGSYGLIGYSEDQGYTYTDQLEANKNRFYLIDFADEENGWVGGNAGSVMRSTDGGDSWEDLSAGQTLLSSVRDGHAVSAEEVWLCGFNGLIRTTNAGQSWEDVYPEAPRFYEMEVTPNRIYLPGYDRMVHRSLNGGQSWEVLDVGSEEVLSSIEFVDDQTGYVGGWQGVLFKTTDGGDTWQSLAAPTDGAIESLLFIDAQEGWLVSSNNTQEVFRTLDGGQSWETVALPANTSFYEIYTPEDSGGSELFLLGGAIGAGYILHTTNNGVDWEVIHTTDHILHSMSVQADDGCFCIHYWFAGLGGTIIQTDYLLVGTQEVLPAIHLHSFPNPTTHFVQLELPELLSSDTPLLITNEAGQLIRTQALNDGKIDLSTLPAGVYQLEMEQNGHRYQARVVRH